MPLDKRIDDAREAAQRLEKELRPGERLLWSGKPRSGIRFSRSDLPATLFMVAWTSFASFFTVAVLRPRLWWFGALVGMTFVMVGLYHLAGRFFLDAWQRRRTFYGLTSERLIVLSPHLSQRTKSQRLETLTDLALKRDRDKSGTITIGPWGGRSTIWRLDSYYGLPTPALTFDQLDDCGTVYEAIAKARTCTKRRGFSDKPHRGG